MPRLYQTLHPQLVPVPIPDRVAGMAGRSIPPHVLQAEMDAATLAAEVGALRPLASAEDRADREDRLAEMARANKIIAAYNPGLIVRAGGAR